MDTAMEKGIAIGKANIFGSSQKKAEAIEYFKQALLENPKEIDAWMWISQLEDDVPTKRYCYKKVLEIDPNHSFAKQAFDFQNATEPRPLLEKVSALQTSFEKQVLPQSKVETFLQRGIIAAKSGDKKSAMQFLKQAIDENPRDVNAWLWISRLVDDPAKKKYCYQKVLEIDPQNRHVIQGMSTLNQSLPTPAKSVEHVQQSQPRTDSPQLRSNPTSQNNKEILRQAPSRLNYPKPIKKTFSAWGMLGLGLFSGYGFFALLGSTINSEGLLNIGVMLGFAWALHYAISGYVGAFKLIKNGQIMQLVGCSILLGGLPLLLPAFLGYFLLGWANWTSPRNNENKLLAKEVSDGLLNSEIKDKNFETKPESFVSPKGSAVNLNGTTVKCKDCGVMVSPSAELCPQCGARYPASYIPSKVIIHRASVLIGMASKMLVSVDGKLIGELKNDDVATCELPYGNHTLSIKGSIPGSFSDQKVISILPSKIYKIEICLTMGLPKLKVNFESYVSDI